MRHSSPRCCANPPRCRFWNRTVLLCCFPAYLLCRPPPRRLVEPEHGRVGVDLRAAVLLLEAVRAPHHRARGEVLAALDPVPPPVAAERLQAPLDPRRRARSLIFHAVRREYCSNVRSCISFHCGRIQTGIRGTVRDVGEVSRIRHHLCIFVRSFVGACELVCGCVRTESAVACVCIVWAHRHHKN